VDAPPRSGSVALQVAGQNPDQLFRLGAVDANGGQQIADDALKFALKFGDQNPTGDTR
jgi:hypothetical protein